MKPESRIQATLCARHHLAKQFCPEPLQRSATTADTHVPTAQVPKISPPSFSWAKTVEDVWNAAPTVQPQLAAEPKSLAWGMKANAPFSYFPLVSLPLKD